MEVFQEAHNFILSMANDAILLKPAVTTILEENKSHHILHHTQLFRMQDQFLEDVQMFTAPLHTVLTWLLR